MFKKSFIIFILTFFCIVGCQFEPNKKDNSKGTINAYNDGIIDISGVSEYGINSLIVLDLNNLEFNRYASQQLIRGANIGAIEGVVSDLPDGIAIEVAESVKYGDSRLVLKIFNERELESEEVELIKESKINISIKTSWLSTTSDNIDIVSDNITVSVLMTAQPKKKLSPKIIIGNDNFYFKNDGNTEINEDIIFSLTNLRFTESAANVLVENVELKSIANMVTNLPSWATLKVVKSVSAGDNQLLINLSGTMPEVSEHDDFTITIADDWIETISAFTKVIKGPHIFEFKVKTEADIPELDDYHVEMTGNIDLSVNNGVAFNGILEIKLQNAIFTDEAITIFQKDKNLRTDSNFSGMLNPSNLPSWLNLKVMENISTSRKNLKISIYGTPVDFTQNSIGYTITLKKEWFEAARSTVKPVKNNEILSGSIVLNKTGDISIDTLIPAWEIKGGETVDGAVELITKDGVKSNSVSVGSDNLYTIDVGDNYSGDLYLVITNLNNNDDVLSPSTPVPTISNLPSVNNILNRASSIVFPSKNMTKPATYRSFTDTINDKYNPEKIEMPKNYKPNYLKKNVSAWSNPYSNVQEGEFKDLYVHDFGLISAKLRKKAIVNNRELLIYVADTLDSKYNSSIRSRYTTTSPNSLISDEYINQLANKFLSDGENDIWGMVNKVFGDEWGSVSNWKSEYSQWLADNYNGDFRFSNNGELIGYAYDKRQMAIILTPLGDNSGLGGFATLQDSYIKNPHRRNSTDGKALETNEITCFYINSEMYKNISDLPQCLTTLAHELQHKITYYQRMKYGFKKNSNIIGAMEREHISRFMTETFSTLAEELVAQSLNISGPGNNDYQNGGAPASGDTFSLINGRIPDFFKGSRYNVIDFDGIRRIAATSGVNLGYYELYAYGNDFSLGAYLVRNYGARFIPYYQNSEDNDIYYGTHPLKNYDNLNKIVEMIPESINKANALTGNDRVTWEKILRGWGASILLSDRTDVKIPFRSSTINANGKYWMENIFLNNNKISSVNYWPFMVDSNHSHKVPYLGGSNYSATKTTTGPVIFNTVEFPYSLLYGNNMAPNTNLFVLVGKNVSGQVSINIIPDDSNNNSNNLRYTFVFKEAT